MLTKSKYIEYLQCKKELWLHEMRPDMMPEVDDNTQRVFDAGYEVETVAYGLFPDGVDIADDIGQSIKETKELLENKISVIFQATVSGKNLFCRSDIVEHDSKKDVWNIIEVKGSTGVRSTHIHDLAFQKTCFENSGYKVGSLSVIHVNNKYVKNGDIALDKFLTRTDVTEKVDPDFEKKRQKYCISETEGNKIMSDAESTQKLVDDINEREENKDIYDAVKNIKKLTVYELQELLMPMIKKNGYANIDFEKPEIQKDIIVGFNLQDAKPDREEYDSVHELQKLINKTLEPINWRLMSDGVMYKLGFLQGRLRGYDGEEYLLKLVKSHKY